MIVSIIAAVSQNGVVGNNGKMPWKCPEEMKFFKEKTTNHPVIMGRATWDSLYIKPLPNRMNIIVTKNQNLHNQTLDTKTGPIFAPSLEDALNYADGTTQEVYIIGGPSIWKHALDQEYVDRMYINVLNKEYEGDSHFPYYDQQKWISEPSKEIYNEFKSYTLIKKVEAEV